MTPEEFVIGIKKMLVDDAIQTYKRLYTEAATSNDDDQYTLDIQHVLSSLDDSGKEALFRVLRIVCVDSVNSFLSVLDGSSGFVGQTGELQLLSTDTPSELLSGDLMTYFYECLEN